MPAPFPAVSTLQNHVQIAGLLTILVPDYSEFQSNGLCQGLCQGAFAFAVLQGNYCWCSNYQPSPTEGTQNCDEQCPGFPQEWCGNTDAGLYGYYLLSAGVPLGTSGSGSSLPSATSSSSTTSPSSSSSSVSTSTSTSLADTGPTTSSNPRSTWSSHSSSFAVVTPGPSQSSVEASVVTSSSEASTYSTSSTVRKSIFVVAPFFILPRNQDII